MLRTQNAAVISVGIARAFVSMRHYIKDNNILLENAININNRLDNYGMKLIEHDEKLEELFSKFEKREYKELIFFEGQIYDAYSKILDIFIMAKNELIIVDGYADKKILDMISKLSVKVVLLTKNKCNLSRREIELYKKQYNNLEVYYTDSFHDRYYIIDKTLVYHCGTSINYAGKIVLSLINSINNHIIK